MFIAGVTGLTGFQMHTLEVRVSIPPPADSRSFLSRLQVRSHPAGIHGAPAPSPVEGRGCSGQAAQPKRAPVRALVLPNPLGTPFGLEKARAERNEA